MIPLDFDTLEENPLTTVKGIACACVITAGALALGAISGYIIVRYFL